MWHHQAPAVQVNEAQSTDGCIGIRYSQHLSILMANEQSNMVTLWNKGKERRKCYRNVDF